jgi:hypothetical protein
MKMINFLLQNLYPLIGIALGLLFYEFLNNHNEYKNEDELKKVSQTVFLGLLWLPFVLTFLLQKLIDSGNEPI